MRGLMRGGVSSFEERCNARFEIKTDRALVRGWWLGEFPFFARERSEGAEEDLIDRL